MLLFVFMSIMHIRVFYVTFYAVQCDVCYLDNLLSLVVSQMTHYVLMHYTQPCSV